ncbi:hypothetical protein C8R45DRAFT_1097823 [Mycena sanguinolenta]|nr:hypothetical protein C8R45DRAFT_1097823 [Mycena sanguinolenta]
MSLIDPTILMKSMLFSAPVPWLHSRTRAQTFDYAAAAKIIAAHFEKNPDRFEPLMEGVAVCNEWLVRPVDPANAEAAVSDSQAVVQWTWGVHMLSPLNNRVRPIIAQVFMPLIVVDTLLFVSDPSPAPSIERAPSRIQISFSQHFRTRSDWTSMLLRSSSCYNRNINSLTSMAPARSASKKDDLLGFWRDMKLTNPLLIVIRNLTHVSLVLSLYLQGDVNLSSDGREDYLLQTARSLGVSLTPAEAKTAVDGTDISLMMAPLFVAMAHSPLALIGPTGYATSQFTSRVPLLETWRALGNVHRVDPLDPLGRIEMKLWRLILRLALREITELQVLRYFFEDEFVRESLKSLNQGMAVPMGRGLGYPGDLLVANAPTLIDLAEEAESEPEATAVQIAALVPKREKPLDEPPKKKRKIDSQTPVASNGAGPSKGLRPRLAPASASKPAVRAVRTPPSRSSTRAASSTSSRAKRPPKPSAPSIHDEDEELHEDHAPASLTYADLRALAVIDGWNPVIREAKTLLDMSGSNAGDVIDASVIYDLASDEYTVEIVYWAFEPASDNASEPLVAIPRKYRYCPFHETRSESAYLKKIVDSQRHTKCKDSDRMLPLHVHPDAQRFSLSGFTLSEEGEPLLPDVLPSDSQSIVYVVHEDLWASLTARQRQEVLRHRAVLVVHRISYLYDGRSLNFDEDGLRAFTHLDRLAFLQGDNRCIVSIAWMLNISVLRDLGSRVDGKNVKLRVGRPRDLLVCSEARKEREREIEDIRLKAMSVQREADEALSAGVPTNAMSPGATLPDVDSTKASADAAAHDNPKASADAAAHDNPAADAVAGADANNIVHPPKTQRLNLLGNTLQSTSLNVPSGWSDLASHEYACNWLDHLSQVPAFVFPWSEVNWKIAATADTSTWIHGDVLFTIVDLPAGEKLWYLGSRRSDLLLDDLRGIMRSRSAFKTFNGWTDMTSVWNFEQVHLSPYTTLYMPATFPHAVISLTDCIGVGRHGIPISNVSHCVYTTLHNTVVSRSTTNADHKPARRFLIRIFIFIVLAFVDPHNGADHTRGLSARTRDHLPDLSISDGVVDLLSLRSFVVLFIALNSSGYAYLVDKSKTDKDLLPVETEAARELSLAWKLAHDLIPFVSKSFTFKKTSHGLSASANDVRTPTSFSDAADVGPLVMRFFSHQLSSPFFQLALVTMAVSMHRYISGAEKNTLPRGFNAKAFRKQATRMLVLFELHHSLSPSQRETQLFANPDSKYRPSEVSLSAEFSRFVDDSTRTFPMLQPWDSTTLPFSLISVSPAVAVS